MRLPASMLPSQGITYLLFIAMFGAAIGHAQVWKPERAVEIVVGSSPGGGTDITARTLQKIFQEQKLIDNVVVVNKPGGGQSVSWSYLNQHAGDANYVSVVNEPLITNRLMGVSKLDYADFTPLALLFNEYVVFTVKPDSPVKSATDLVGRLKQDLGALSFGQGSSRGNNAHIAIGLLGRAVGGDLKRQKMVVLGSGGEAMTAVMGGHIDIGVSTIAPAIQIIKAGRVRALAVTADKRLDEELAVVPAWKELGIDVVYGSWRLVFGPRGLTSAQIAFWENALLKATRTEAWRKALSDNQQDSAYRNAAATKKFLDAEAERLRPLFVDLGLAK